jgi:prefoldin alpha subunit
MTEEKKKVEDEVKERYMELQMIGNRIKQLQAQVESVSERILNMKAVQKSLDELKEVKLGSNTLVPISEGIFVKAKLQDVKELVVNVGGEVCVKKSVEDTKGLIEKQLSGMKGHRNELLFGLEKLGMQAERLEKELSGLVE